MAEAAQRWPGRCPAPASCPALRRGNVHGALDMGLAPGLLPGRVTLDAGRDWFTRAWGSVPAAAGPRRRRHPGRGGRRSGRGRHGSARWSLLGADPLADFPDRRPGRAGPRRRRVRGGGGLVAGPVTERGRRGPAGGRGPRAARDHHQHRGPGQPAGPEAGAARPGLARLDDRRRAGRPPRRRPRPRLGRATSGTRSSGWPRPTAASPGPCSTPRGTADGVVAPLAGQPGLDRPTRRPAAARPHRLPRGGVGGAPGGTAPGRTGRVARPPGRRVGRPATDDRGARRPGAGPSLLAGTGRAATSPMSRRSTATRCGWWPPGPSTTTGAAVGAVPGPGRPGGRGPAAGQPPRPRRPGGGRPGGSVRVRTASGIDGGAGRARQLPAPQGGGRRLQRAPRRGRPSPTSSTPVPRWSSCGWRPRERRCCRPGPPAGRPGTRSTTTAWTGWCSSSW